jgi:hypothetical protein
MGLTIVWPYKEKLKGPGRAFLPLKREEELRAAVSPK